MKRYLTVGIIFGVLVVTIVIISWFGFPAWKNPASGGFWTLLGLSGVGVLSFIQGMVSIWKDLKEEKKEEPKPASTSADLDVGGNVGGNLTVGNSNVINNYYQQVVEKNIEKHEPEGWYLAHPYPMPPNFTGRIAERAKLTHWLKDDSENHLFILRALGGFGKSALTWHWLTHDVDIKEYPKVVFWSFYEGDASFEHFIEETLKYIKLEVPQGQRPQVDELLKAMHAPAQKILLIIDGFERALRAYSSMNAAYQGDEPKFEDNQLDCVNINAEFFLKGVCALPNIKSKVLMTTRLTPRAVKPHGEFILGCREVELTAMQKADAVEFFHKQKIKGTHAEIEAACAPYGYHPLSLRLLAGRILKDFENPADIVVAQKLKIDGDLKQHEHHVLEVSYNSLPEHEQKLLSTIACFRSPVELKTLETIAENKNSLGNDLQDLRERGLLHFDEKNKKFDLHPIVRRYTYERLTTPDRTAAHTRLRDYFATVDVPAQPQTLDDLAPVVELYHQTVRAGEFDEARDLLESRLVPTPLFYQFGASYLIIELLRSLFPDGEEQLPKIKGEAQQAWTLLSLANLYAVTGQPYRAVQLYEFSNDIYENKIKKLDYLSVGLQTVAYSAQHYIGILGVAESNLRRSIKLCKDFQNGFYEAAAHCELGKLLSYRGVWDEAKQEFSSALASKEKTNYQLESTVWAHQVQYVLVMSRDPVQSKIINPKSAIQFAQHALNLAEEWQKQIGRSNVDNFINAHWALGLAYRLNGQFVLAEQHLNEALMRDRAVTMVRYEANILLDLARLRYDQKNYEEAKSLADEALLITERCGYVLQGADVNLFLAQYALEQEQDKAKAKGYAEEAKKLATCDGPPYYYKVAYEEAVAMLEHLKV